MLRIRFRRIGLKSQPTYRIVITDQRKARNGAELEVIGFHNPRTRPSTDIVKVDRALYWMSVGAQPTDAARRVLERAGTLKLLERLRQGEAMDVLIQEAQSIQPEPVSPKTRYPAPVGAPKVEAAAEAE